MILYAQRLVRKLCPPYSPDGKYLFRNGAFILAEKTDLPDPETMLSSAKILKDSPTTTAGISGEYFIKRYNRTGWWRAFKRSLQFPRSFRSLAASVELLRLGLLTPKVLFASRFLLVTERLPENTRFLSCLNDPGETLVRVREFLPRLSKLHAEGFHHGDLSLRNIYIRSDGAFGLIDLDAFRQYSSGIPAGKRMKEVARIISSAIIISKVPQQENLIAELLDIYLQSGGSSIPLERLVRKCKKMAEHTVRRDQAAGAKKNAH